MKWMLSLCTFLFVLSLLYRGEGQPPARELELVEHVVGLSEIELVEIRLEMLATHSQVQKLRARADGPEKQRQMHSLMSALKANIEQRLTPAQRDQMELLPTGNGERQHHYRELVLKAPGLKPEQSSLLGLALTRAQKAPQDEHTETRFWAIAGLVLDPEQMIEIKKELPWQYQTQPRPDNYFALPYLSGSVANRVLSNFLNLESETTAARVRIQQLEKDHHTEGSIEQIAKMREMMGLRREMLQTREALVAELAEHLNPQQRAILDSVPPFGSFAYQNKLSEWLTKPERLTAQQKAFAIDPLKQLHQDWREAEPEIQARVENFGDPQARGGMSQMIETRDLVKPLEARRLALARQIALKMTEQQLSDFLEEGATP